MRRRWFKATVAALGAATFVITSSLVAGHASSLTSGTNTLGANSAAVGRCTGGGVGIIQNLAGANVVSVTVSQLPSSCGNASISVALNNGITSSTGSATVPAAGGSVTVTLGTAIAAKDAEEIDVSVNGP